MIKHKTLLLFLITLHSAGLWANIANGVTTFQANYKLTTKGITIGTAQKTLSKINQHQYRYALDVTPSKLVQFFRSKEDRLHLYSIFTINDQTLDPIKYQISDKEGTKMLTFEHSGLQACQSSTPKRCWSATPAEKLYDPASVEIAYARYLMQQSHKNHSKTYAVIGDTINLTTLSTDNTIDTMTLNSKTYRVIKVMMTEKSMATGKPKDRYTILWLSPDIHYVPVKIERHQQKNKVLISTLTDYNAQ